MSVLSPRERYLNNFIDKQIQDMLFPLDIPMSLLLIPKYNLDGFITPNTRFRNLKTVLINIFILIVLYIRFTTSIVFKYSEQQNNSIIITLYIDVFYYSIALSSFCISNIINSNNITNLVLNLQKSFRSFRSIEKDVRRLTYWNWVSMVVIPAYYIFFIMITYNDDILGLLMNFLPLLYYDVSIIYVTRLIWILTHQLKMWVRELERCNGILEKSTVLEGQKMLESYCYIMDAFDLFKKFSPQPIALQIIELMSHVLMYLQVAMDVQKQAPDVNLISFISSPGKMSIVMWTIKNYILLGIVCYALNKFYCQVLRVVEVCSAALKLDLPEPTRQLCKNVRRFTHARFEHLEVCGVRVDARLPLRLAGVLAAYVVVVLQFNMS